MAAWQDWLLAQAKNGVSQNELDFLEFKLSIGRESKKDMLENFQHLASDIEVLIHRQEKQREIILEPCLEPKSFHLDIRIDRTIRPMQACVTYRNPAYDFNIVSLRNKDLLGNYELWAVLNSRHAYWGNKRLRFRGTPLFKTLQEAMDWCRHVAVIVIPKTRTLKVPHVKWESVRLLCGDSYTEWLITQPNHIFAQELKPNSHFDADNLLMHLRTSINSSGDKKILLIEEIQSDYLQNQRRLEKNRKIKLTENPYESSWVDLGLRVAVLIACRQGLDGVAVSTGEMQTEIDHIHSIGRELFYDEKVANSLKKLAKPLAAETRQFAISATTQIYRVLDAGPDHTGSAKRFSVNYLGIPNSKRASFDTFQEADDFRKSVETTLYFNVPVLWLNAAQRVSLMRLGLPVLGAVDKLPASASPHAHA